MRRRTWCQRPVRPRRRTSRQSPTLIPTALDLADIDLGDIDLGDVDLASIDGGFEAAAERVAALTNPVAPIIDRWSQIRSGALDLTREVAPAVDFDRGLAADIALLAGEFALVEDAVAAARSTLEFDADANSDVPSEDDTAHEADAHVDHDHDHEVETPPTVVADTAEAAPVVPVVMPVVATPTERGAAALAAMPVHPAELGFTVSFLGPRAGYKGLTFPYEHRIEIYVDPTWTDHELAHVLAHEIGHAVDVERNDLADHNRWRQARAISGDVAWWPGAYATDFETPGGDFAECFAAWAVGTPATPTTPFGTCAGTGGLMHTLVHG